MEDYKQPRTAVLSAPDASCHSKIHAETFKYNWTIENFTLCKSDHLTSTDFSMGNGKVIWYHRLWPARSNPRLVGPYVDIETKIKSCDPGDASLHGSLKIKIQQTEQNSYNEEFTSSESLVSGGYLGAESIKISRASIVDKTRGLLVNNVLQLCMQVTIVQNLPCQGGNAQIAVPKSQLVPNLSSLFLDKKHSDVKITVGNKEFPCHKAILAVRSSVFAAMFEHPMEETRQNCIIITDIEPIVFQELLRFLYTDQVQDLDNLASDLLAAADKYAVDRLKALCEQSLHKNLSVATAIETLVLADMHQAGQLKRQAIAFINRNGANVAAKHWNRLCVERSDLVGEVLAARSVGNR